MFMKVLEREGGETKRVGERKRVRWREGDRDVGERGVLQSNR